MSVTVDELRLSAKAIVEEFYSKFLSGRISSESKKDDFDLVRNRLLQRLEVTQDHKELMALVALSDTALRNSYLLKNQSRFDHESLKVAINAIQAERAAYTEQMAAARSIMKEDRDVLARLAL